MRRAILFALCVALSSTTMAQGIFTRLFGGSTRYAADMEAQYRVVKGRKLGAFLAGKFAGKRAVVLFPPEAPVMGGEEGDPGEMPHVAVFKGLKAAMGDIEIVGTIKPRMPAGVKAKIKVAGGEGDMMMMPEAMQWFGVKELNKELAAFKGKYDILVCLTSLPGVERMMGMRGLRAVPFTELTCWTEKGVSVALAEGGISRFRSQIESGAICAMATYKMQIPDADYEKRPAKDLDEAFSTRYVLITSENIAKHAAYFRDR
jgi:hypothetical protein